MNELGLEQALQAVGRLVGGVLEGFQEHGDDGLDFRVLDDAADNLEGVGTRFLDLCGGEEGGNRLENFKIKEIKKIKHSKN